MVQGNDCILSFNFEDDIYEQVFCGKSFTLVLSTEFKETTTKGDGQYTDYDYHALSYTLDIDGLMVLDQEANTFDVLAAQRRFGDVPFKIEYIEGSNIRVVEGRLIVTNTEIIAAAGQSAGYSHSFRGRGPYELRSTAEPCYTFIGEGILAVTYSLEGGYVRISINDVTGPWASFNWAVSGGPSGNSTSQDFFLPLLDAGTYSISLTPVCENGVSGTGVTTGFTVE